MKWTMSANEPSREYYHSVPTSVQESQGLEDGSTITLDSNVENGSDETLFEVHDAQQQQHRPELISKFVDDSVVQSRHRTIHRMASEISSSDDTQSRRGSGHYTLEEAIDTIGLGWFQIKTYLVCGVVSMADAIEMLLLAFLSPSVRCEWYLNSSQVALVTTVVFIGMGISAPLLGMFGDKYGRKTALLYMAFVIGYFGLLTTISPSYYWLLFLRGIVGCGMGGSPQGAALLSEYLPKKYRAKLLTFGQIFFALGVLFEVVLAAILIPTMGWRWLMAASAVPVIITAVGLFFIPESARFLLAAGQRKKAVRILEEAAKLNKSKLPPGKLVQSEAVSRGQISNLFAPEYLRSTLQLWVLWFGFAFVYYGMVLAATELLRLRNDVGVSAKDVTDCHCKFLSSKDYTTMILSTLGEFACFPVNLLLIDWLGRRWTAGLNMCVVTILILLMLLPLSWGTFTVVLFGVRGLSSVYGGLLYIYTAEIYPTSVRTLGMGTASAWARIGAMITPFIAQVLLTWSPSLACLIYALVCFVCAICAFTMPIETLERALPQTVSIEMTPSLSSDQIPLVSATEEFESD